MPVTNLPIEAIRSQLPDAAQRSGQWIVQAPTGSGKSTQLPQMLLDEGLVTTGRILVLQPRRLAARLLASRVAQERGTRLGDAVGFHIRFDRVYGPDTRIVFITEGILLRMMLGEPTLPGIAAIVFDEFHERHLYGDLGIAMVKRLQDGARPDLRMVVMSATLDTDALQTYLPEAVTLQAEGRTFPITTHYLEGSRARSEAPVWELATQAFQRWYREQPDGDFLIFMPGSYEIQRTVQDIMATAEGRKSVVLPLHGELPPDKQDAAVAQYDKRKVVVATNVAETSLTIDGIRIVIDSGLARISRFDPHRGINTLLIEKISRASADQRAGRAGRTAPGICQRLWSEKDHTHRAAQETPEIRRVDLSETLLQLLRHERLA